MTPTTRTEDRLRDAFAATAATLRPEEARPLTVPGTCDRITASQRRWRVGKWIAPVATAAAIVAVVATVTHLGPIAQPDPGAAGSPPRFYVAANVMNVWTTAKLTVHEATTGRTVSTVPPPRKGEQWLDVAAAGPAAFVLASDAPAARWASPYRFNLLRLTGNGHAASITPLNISIPQSGVHLLSMAATRDGGKLALATRNDSNGFARLDVVLMKTAERFSWSVPGGALSLVNSLSWTADGRTLAFMFASIGREEVRLLDTSHAPAAGASVLDSRVVVRGNVLGEPVPKGYPLPDFPMIGAAISPDGRSVVALFDYNNTDLVEFSTANGRRLRTLVHVSAANPPSQDSRYSQFKNQFGPHSTGLSSLRIRGYASPPKLVPIGPLILQFDPSGTYLLFQWQDFGRIRLADARFFPLPRGNGSAYATW
jgi:hypothetical protein